VRHLAQPFLAQAAQGNRVIRRPATTEEIPADQPLQLSFPKAAQTIERGA
jgi:hypothetical protein